MDHSYLQITSRLPLSRKRSPDGASPNWCCRHLIAACYSFIYRKRMTDWVGWLADLYSGRFTQLSSHPSAAGRAQRRESSPVKNQRSTTVPRNQPMMQQVLGLWLSVYWLCKSSVLA